MLVRNCGILPANESIARPLGQLVEEPGILETAWSEVLDTAPKAADGDPLITAKHVKAVVKRYRPKDEGEQPDPGTCTVEDLNELVERGIRFGTFYVDPPWDYDNRATRAAAKDHYATEGMEWLESLPVEQLTRHRYLCHLKRDVPSTPQGLRANLDELVPESRERAVLYARRQRQSSQEVSVSALLSPDRDPVRIVSQKYCRIFTHYQVTQKTEVHREGYIYYGASQLPPFPIRVCRAPWVPYVLTLRRNPTDIDTRTAPKLLANKGQTDPPLRMATATPIIV